MTEELLEAIIEKLDRLKWEQKYTNDILLDILKCLQIKHTTVTYGPLPASTPSSKGG